MELNLGKEIKGIETEEDCCLIRSSDRFLVSASRGGQVKTFSMHYEDSLL